MIQKYRINGWNEEIDREGNTLYWRDCLNYSICYGEVRSDGESLYCSSCREKGLDKK